MRPAHFKGLRGGGVEPQREAGVSTAPLPRRRGAVRRSAVERNVFASREPVAERDRIAAVRVRLAELHRARLVQHGLATGPRSVR